MQSEAKLAKLQTNGRSFGVFTLSRIAEGGNIFAFEGDERWVWEIAQEKLDRCLQVGIDRYIVPSPHSSGWYLNHSCISNSYVSGKDQIVAIRDIEPREEITMDYSLNVVWGGFRMKCKCQSPNCRSIISDYFSLPEDIRVNGRKYTSEYLLGLEFSGSD